MLRLAILYDEKTIKTTSGLIQSAFDCFEHARNVYGPKWHEQHKNDPVSEFVCLFGNEEGGEIDAARAEHGSIDRSLAAYSYDSIPGIRSMRQFMRHADGVVIARTFTCWCDACWAVERRGCGCNSVGIVDGCTSCTGSDPIVPIGMAYHRNVIHSQYPSNASVCVRMCV